MSAYRLAVQTLHRLGGSAKSVQVEQFVPEAHGPLIYASKRNLVEGPGWHGQNSLPYTITRLGTAFAEGFASHVRLPKTPTKPRQPRIIGYNWMAPLMPSPEATQAHWDTHQAVWNRGIYADSRN